MSRIDYIISQNSVCTYTYICPVITSFSRQTLHWRHLNTLGPWHFWDKHAATLWEHPCPCLGDAENLASIRVISLVSLAVIKSPQPVALSCWPAAHPAGSAPTASSPRGWDRAGTCQWWGLGKWFCRSPPAQHSSYFSPAQGCRWFHATASLTLRFSFCSRQAPTCLHPPPSNSATALHSCWVLSCGAPWAAGPSDLGSLWDPKAPSVMLQLSESWPQPLQCCHSMFLGTTMWRDYCFPFLFTIGISAFLQLVGVRS